REDVPRAPPRQDREAPSGGASMYATARFALRAADRQTSSYCARLHPDSPQCAVDGFPLLPLGGELCSAFFRDPVVLAPAATLGRVPLRHDITLALETMHHGIQHAVGPLQLSSGQLGHSLDDS